jgi:hypothetical protein
MKSRVALLLLVLSHPTVITAGERSQEPSTAGAAARRFIVAFNNLDMPAFMDRFAEAAVIIHPPSGPPRTFPKRVQGKQGAPSIDTRLGKSVDLADRLRGIAAVQVIREAPTDADKQCGLADDSALVAATRAVEDGGLKLSEDRRAPIVSLDLATAFVKEFGLCISHVRIALSTIVVAVPQASPGYEPNPGSRIGPLQVMSRQMMSWSAPAAHGERVRARVSELVGQIVAEITLANK